MRALTMVVASQHADDVGDEFDSPDPVARVHPSRWLLPGGSVSPATTETGAVSMLVPESLPGDDLRRWLRAVALRAVATELPPPCLLLDKVNPAPEYQGLKAAQLGCRRRG
ncbi:MAG TPA: hypothetical protein VLS45_04605 [Methylomicrobium sp.]|nr:hypothetical protein [Methylomicrobium sp.]